MTPSTSQDNARPFTGRHMIYVMVGFFGVIITVNIVMAVLANRSWTGLVVKNSYVASQHFNEKLTAAQAQAALGWAGTLVYENRRLVFSLRTRDGQAVYSSAATATVRRPIHEREDLDLVLEASPEGLSAPADLGPGVWDVDVTARRPDGGDWRKTFRIHVPQGGAS